MKRWERCPCAWVCRACCLALGTLFAGGCNGDAEKAQPLNLAFNATTPAAAERPPAPVSDTVRNSVLSPAGTAATRNAMQVTNGEVVSIPTTRRAVAGVGTGSHIIIGAVVVEVNGTPIFANKVLNTITPVLAAKAKEVDATRFKGMALNEIREQVTALVYDELEFAVADRNLDANDKRIADLLTMQWRTEQIRRYGGSLQLARQAANQQGQDFDDVVKDRHRLELRRVYFQRKELPRIQITADDMRSYYQRHLNDQFTDRDQAQFRVIKVGFKQTGGQDKAKAKAEDLRKRAANGEDFAQLAGSFNDDAYLLKHKGDPTGGTTGWIDRGAYANTKLEDAVWKIAPEQVSELVESNDAFYIARLERKKTGRVKSFNEEAVQQQIRKTLEAEQFVAMRTRMQQRLRENAIIYPEPPLYAPVLEMAMQKYPEWSAANR